MEYYDVLANTVGGGKPKMRYHFDNNGWPAFFGGSQVPASEEQKSAMVDALQDQKTEFYKEIVESTATARYVYFYFYSRMGNVTDVVFC